MSGHKTDAPVYKEFTGGCQLNTPPPDCRNQDNATEDLEQCFFKTKSNHLSVVCPVFVDQRLYSAPTVRNYYTY